MVLRFAQRGALVGFLMLASASGDARAQDTVIQPWDDLDDGFAASFTWPWVSLQVAAVAVTPPLAYEVDGPVQDYFQQVNPFGETFPEIMLVGGYFVPVLVPLGIYLGGIGAEHDELATAGAAALQAVFVQGVIVTSLKWITDRAGPYPDGDPERASSGLGYLRNSNDPLDWDFNPFSLDGALRWPSGHTASHIALVSSLCAFYPDEVWLPLVGYPVVLAVAIGMVEGDYHWLSDVLAGALMGYAIGRPIGSHFRERYDAAREDDGQSSLRERNRTTWLPSATRDGFMLRFGGAWD
jgi:membrane-associated phospholipid phosphatase